MMLLPQQGHAKKLASADSAKREVTAGGTVAERLHVSMFQYQLLSAITGSELKKAFHCSSEKGTVALGELVDDRFYCRRRTTSLHMCKLDMNTDVTTTARQAQESACWPH